MSARDHLNPQQFMPATELGKMRSQYTDPATGRPLTLDEAYARPDVRYTARNGPAQHEALRASIREKGIKNSIVYDPDRRSIEAGHHRYFAGRDEGLTQFPVNDFSRKERYRRVPGFDDW